MIHIFIIIISFLLIIDLHSEYSIVQVNNNLTKRSEIFNSIGGCSSQLMISSVRDFSIINYWFKFYYSNDGGTNWQFINSLEKYKNSEFDFVDFHRSNHTDITIFCNKNIKKIIENDTLIGKVGFLLKSSDSGNSFYEEILKDSISIGNIRMISPLKGYLFSKNQILFTEDSWQTYTSLLIPELDDSLNYFLTENGCFISFPSQLNNFYFSLYQYNQEDKSFNKNKIKFEVNKPHSRTYFKFNSLHSGFAFVEYQNPLVNPEENHLDIYKTENSGINWKLIYQFKTIEPLMCRLDFLDTNFIILITAEKFFITENNGVDWLFYRNKTKDFQWHIPKKIFIVNKDSIIFNDANVFLIYRKDTITLVNTELDIYHLSITPQPASDKLFLNSKNLDYINSDISIFNNLGVKVFQTKMNIISNQDNFIELNTLPSGLYFLVLKAGDQTLTKKFLIFRE
ncbi:MAG: T9SS type A sorting domain-containing protein [Candidatus Kapabacteria bacterium]|nr:T9SS type A sorting domain-containing protein [Candidatus Kapabacteria bacterium]